MEDSKDDEDEDMDKEVTLSDVLDKMQSEGNFVDALLENLALYCHALKKAVDANPQLLGQERTKLAAVNPNFSH